MLTTEAEERALALALIEAIEGWQMRGMPRDELDYSCRLTAIAQAAMKKVAGHRGLSMLNTLYDARHRTTASEIVSKPAIAGLTARRGSAWRARDGRISREAHARTRCQQRRDERWRCT